MNRFGLKAILFLAAAAALWCAGCASPGGGGTTNDVVIMDGVMHKAGPNETIYLIAKTYEVSPELLARVNGIDMNSPVSEGTRLFIPGATEYRAVDTNPAQTVYQPAAPDGLWHQVGQGETLIGIAKAYEEYDVTVQELQRVNNLPDARQLRAGQVLWIPRAKEVKDVEVAQSTIIAEAPVKEAKDDPRIVQKVVPKPTPTPTEKKPEETANKEPTPKGPEKTFPREVTEIGDARFQWPLKDNFRVLRPYSTAADTMNAGIDLSAPEGTTIYAAADGKVQLVGGVDDDLGGSFGNFIILYHGKRNNEDLRTIYAHNQENLVTVGQLVKRGDAIAKVGKTGAPPANSEGVLHFEIRESTKALDPQKALPSLK